MSQTLNFHRISSDDFDSNLNRFYHRGDVYFIYNSPQSNNGQIYLCNQSGNKRDARFELYSSTNNSVEFGDILGNPKDNRSLKDELDSKVDKETGKGLSSNDYTNEDKELVSTISTKESTSNKVQTLDRSETHYPSSNAVISVTDDLSDRIRNISTIGRFLSTWRISDGLPSTNPVPPILPSERTKCEYEYRKGDYYIIGTPNSDASYKDFYKLIIYFNHGGHTKLYTYVTKSVNYYVYKCSDPDPGLTPSIIYFKLDDGEPTINSVAYDSSLTEEIGTVTKYGTFPHKITVNVTVPNHSEVEFYFTDFYDDIHSAPWIKYAAKQPFVGPSYVLVYCNIDNYSFPAIGDNVYISPSTSSSILGTITGVSNFVDIFIPDGDRYTYYVTPTEQSNGGLLKAGPTLPYDIEGVPSIKQLDARYTVNQNDVFMYDGSTWILQINSERATTFESIVGEPTDNLKLRSALFSKENTSNKVTELLSTSTHDQYPSAKCVYDAIFGGYQFMGVAIPETDPGTPNKKIFYLAGERGSYDNFSSLTVYDGEIAILKYDAQWHKEVIEKNDRFVIVELDEQDIDRTIYDALQNGKAVILKNEARLYTLSDYDDEYYYFSSTDGAALSISGWRISVTTGESSSIDINYENSDYKVTTISSSSTDDQYPSAKCVYNIVGNIETALNTIIGG